MTQIFVSITFLLVSVFIILFGHGLQLTVAPLYAAELGWSVTVIGYTGSAYFLGFALGCLTIPRLVSRVGHIRVFAALSSVATAALLMLALFHDVTGWMIARLVTGWSIAGIYMVFESWLSERTSAENRGFVLSVYTVLSLSAICLGQLMIGSGLGVLQLIIVGAVLLAVGSIPVGLTRSAAPTPIPRVGFQFKEVYREAHVAVAGALVSGLVTSSFWVLGPVVARNLSLSDEQIGYFLAFTILGGTLSQLPVGRLSDRVDRRKVLAVMSLVSCGVCLAACLLVASSVSVLYLFMFLLGATIFPIYSISLAHANDNTTLSLIETGSVILLLYSAGAVVGPIFISLLMDHTSLGLFIFAGIVQLIFALWAIVRISRHKVRRDHFEPFQDVPRTTLSVMEMSEPETEVTAGADRG